MAVLVGLWTTFSLHHTLLSPRRTMSAPGMPNKELCGLKFQYKPQFWLHTWTRCSLRTSSVTEGTQYHTKLFLPWTYCLFLTVTAQRTNPSIDRIDLIQMKYPTFLIHRMRMDLITVLQKLQIEGHPCTAFQLGLNKSGTFCSRKVPQNCLRRALSSIWTPSMSAMTLVDDKLSIDLYDWINTMINGLK